MSLKARIKVIDVSMTDLKYEVLLAFENSQTVPIRIAILFTLLTIFFIDRYLVNSRLYIAEEVKFAHWF